MDKYLKPTELNIDPKSPSAEDEWEMWIEKFEDFFSSIDPTLHPNKLTLLKAHMSCSCYKLVKSAGTYDEAKSLLKSRFVKPRNEVYARHRLASRKQQPGESLDTYLEELGSLASQCMFKAVTAEQAKEDAIRDAFISGISSNAIRQRLLENLTLDLAAAVSQARALEMAQKQSEMYHNQADYGSVTAHAHQREGASATEPKLSEAPEETTAALLQKCFFCGGPNHPRNKCRARNAICSNCGKQGHYAKVCQSEPLSLQPPWVPPSQPVRGPGQGRGKGSARTQTTASMPILSAIPNCSLPSLKSAMTSVTVNGHELEALIDTGSSQSYIRTEVAKRINLDIAPSRGAVCMASTQHQVDVAGQCIVKLQVGDEEYADCKLSVMDDLCAPVLLGHDFLGVHDCVCLTFGGSRPSLSLCCLAQAVVRPPSLFSNLTPDCHPIQAKSRRYSSLESKFIEDEVSRLLKEGIIAPSVSPWRAQVLVVPSASGKRRMVVDYSQTVNRFTELNAYPIPRINEQVEKIAQYSYFSTVDLRSAYHQIPITPEERKYTAFEAGGRLYEFHRIPFGVTNGVACFQQILDDIIQAEGLQDTFAYVDDVTICGRDKEQHDSNLKRFLDAAERYSLTINEDKCTFGSTSVKILGHVIENRQIQPDPDRLQALMDLPVPQDAKSLKRAIGMLSHYSKWVPSFSEKLQPLVASRFFPLTSEAVSAYENLKKDIGSATMSSVDDYATFVVETDASDSAIAATLTQNGKPVAFFSRTLSPSERRQPSIEKEAAAIIESIRKWRHLLIGKHFKLVTDQRSVSFMFSKKCKGRIKNDKILRWRLELACMSFEIAYRPGVYNTVSDMLSRAEQVCGAVPLGSIEVIRELHDQMCHPGVTRLCHYLRAQNIAFSVDEVRNVVSQCRTCSVFKPSFVQTSNTLIKATRVFERLSVDFKGPLPSCTERVYLFVVVDEFSRFPFAFPIKDTSAETAVRCLTSLFTVFGTPEFIHSDRGAAFTSAHYKEFLLQNRIAQSFCSAYNAPGNGQTERYNGTIWKAVSMACHSQGIDIKSWETILPVALHSIRSLLCTATNQTPHERFFKHPRRSASGQALPTWLLTADRVLLKRTKRTSKYEPLVDEVELVHITPTYAKVRLPSGREPTVPLRHLAPIDSSANLSTDYPTAPPIELEEVGPGPTGVEEDAIHVPPADTLDAHVAGEGRVGDSENRFEVRKSGRKRVTPKWMSDYQQ